MGIVKPYKRIYRRMLSGQPEYLRHLDYAVDKRSNIHSYHLIEKDLKVLFDYISPDDRNDLVFSHRIYELFFRCCTEFENNAKSILIENGYTRVGSLTIQDYFRVNEALKLNEYEVRINMWENNVLNLKPFELWNSSTYVSLGWYRDYNFVKHNRSSNFHLANLRNLLTASAGLLVILYAQFAYHSFSPYQEISQIGVDDEGFESGNDSLFSIKPYEWREDEKYDFNWGDLRAEANPYNNFEF